MDRVPEPAEVDDRVGQIAGIFFGSWRRIGGVGHHSLQAADREGQRGDVVVIEDARGHDCPERLAAAIGEEGDLAGEVGRQLVEGPAESIEPAHDPFEPLLVLAPDLLGDDPVLPGRPDVIEVASPSAIRRRCPAAQSGAAAPGTRRRSGPAARANP